MDNIKTLLTIRPGITPPTKMVLETPEGLPNVEVVPMSWWAQILVRVTRTYLQSVVGTITTLTAGKAVIGATVSAGAADAMGLAIDQFGGVLLASASLAVMPAVICLITNLIEILTKLDTSRPGLRG